ncbi:NAD-dependent epimerase/dehydratase family protein [Sporolactobacillus vineae]|uniref:NAD-dependent epimerase/dehydratase family protein n=1 Tax=Sporolactobacillus vineae TaxID=444463 RepID=UPI000288DD41|nr:NAD-dependent epimerase/dehydratase family protein [Sporolactobacillus vineae]
MKIVVTGAAGFIGSHLCERLLQNPEHTVIGIDSLVNERKIRLRNLIQLLEIDEPRFQFFPVDLLTADLQPLLDGADAVYHLAGVPGVRSSWGSQFRTYVENNILVTQRLLEACKGLKLKRFIYVSTSSVYGEKEGRITEDARTQPLSPYGVSKLAGEHLCRIYWQTEGVPAVILRYFTVYGPRQRPDMAFHKFIHQILKGDPVPVYGDGLQSRDFTYISDCVEATATALRADHIIGETINIGGHERASIQNILKLLEELTGKPVAISTLAPAKGEPRHTWADISKAQALLHYHPAVSLKSGLQREISDLKAFYKKELNS